jgi:putative hydrolase of the HAD superfamily
VTAPIVDGLVLSRCDRSVFIPPQDALPPCWRGESRLPELLIFDLDDTLYSERDFVRSGHRAAAQAVWRDYGIDIESELQRRFALGQRGDLFTAALKSRNLEVPLDYVERVLVPAYREHTPMIEPYVGTTQVLRQLRAAGHRTALLSDGWAAVQRRKLNALGLAELFDDVVLTDELGRASWKPSTRGFELILERQAVSPANAAYVAELSRHSSGNRACDGSREAASERCKVAHRSTRRSAAGDAGSLMINARQDHLLSEACMAGRQ